MTVSIQIEPFRGFVVVSVDDFTLLGPASGGATRARRVHDSRLCRSAGPFGVGWRIQGLPDGPRPREWAHVLSDGMGRRIELSRRGDVATLVLRTLERTFLALTYSFVNDLLVRVEDEHGVREEYEYDCGLLVGLRERGGGWRYLEYDGADELARVTRTVADGGCRERRYLYTGTATLIEDSTGVGESFYRDEHFRCVRRTARDGVTRRFVYAGQGAELISEIDETGREERVEGNVTTPEPILRAERGLVRELATSTGAVLLGYSSYGTLSEIRSDMLRVRVTARDDGSLAELVAPSGERITLPRRDPRCGISWRRADASVYAIERDLGGRPVHVRCAGRQLRLDYDAAYDLVRLSDGAQQIDIERDRGGRARRLRREQELLELEYDMAGRLIRGADSVGRTRTLERDGHGRVTEICCPAGQKHSVDRAEDGRIRSIRLQHAPGVRLPDASHDPGASPPGGAHGSGSPEPGSELWSLLESTRASLLRPMRHTRERSEAHSVWFAGGQDIELDEVAFAASHEPDLAVRWWLSSGRPRAERVAALTWLPREPTQQDYPLGQLAEILGELDLARPILQLDADAGWTAPTPEDTVGR